MRKVLLFLHAGFDVSVSERLTAKYLKQTAGQTTLQDTRLTQHFDY